MYIITLNLIKIDIIYSVILFMDMINSQLV